MFYQVSGLQQQQPVSQLLGQSNAALQQQQLMQQQLLQSKQQQQVQQQVSDLNCYVIYRCRGGKEFIRFWGSTSITVLRVLSVT